MRNPDYSPERAHLPNDDDNRRWARGGRAKEMVARERMTRFAAKLKANRDFREKIEKSLDF